MASTRRLAAIMFTDMVGSTASAQTNETEALKLRDEQAGLVRPLFVAHQGREIKSMGDGFLAEFDSALRATQCAVDIQQKLHERNSQPGATPIQLRIGVHLGDVEQRESDIFGDAVNIAARIEPEAEPGGICLSGAVYEQVRNKVSFPIEKLGSKTLDGIKAPMEVYRVVLPWAAVTALPAAHVGPPRLAVLPFVNISRDPENEYFADGMTEELISVISQVKGLRVISRTSVSQYKGVNKPLAQIGADLGVDSVLEGSVRKAGDRLRISVQLIETKTDEHRWAKTYDRKLEDVFAIQAEVAEQTAAALKLHLLQSEREAIQGRPTASLAAYESYLRGIQANRKWQEAGFYSQSTDQEAVKHFEAAIAEDPKFSAAYSYLATHLIGVMGETRPAREVIPRVRELVVKALELNPNSSDAHLAQANLAMQGDLDWTHAETEFQQAISLNPSGSAARYWYGYLLQSLQRFGEATKQFLAAAEQDPVWEAPRTSLAWGLSMVGDWATTTATLEELVRRFPESRNFQNLLGLAYARGGRADDARKLVESRGSPTDFRSRANRAVVLASIGETEELRTLVTDWEKGRLEGYHSLELLASYHALLGNTESALSLLEQDFREGDRALWGVYQWESFDSIRDDPRFVALLRAMHLPTTLTRPLRRYSPR